MRQLLKVAVLAAAGAARILLFPRRSPTQGASDAERGSRAWIKDWLFKGAVLLAVLGAGGFFVAASGIVPITASSGHWAITTWFLQFAKQRSVATHTLGIETPSLDEARLVLKGAGHYDIGCRPCHGSPEFRHPRVAQAMTPPPPYLPMRVSEWEPAELFYIVKHGIKLTGMPAWPTQQRDDEVWAMVAFLLTFPDLDAQEYRRLVHGETPASGRIPPINDLSGPLEAGKTPRRVIESCGSCHGVDGHGRGVGAFPKLAGQRPAYLYAALQAFARGKRHSGIMEPIAAGLSDEEIREIALYYGSLQESSPLYLHQDLAPAIERGKEIAQRGIPSQRVPSCTDCHGPGTTRRNPAYPLLAGQYADYLVLQLELFKKEHRGGSPYTHLMRPIASRLTPEQMRDVALYYESLTSTPAQ